MSKKKSFVVATVATMSSGKSTTLNAMLGVPLLPSKNEACTATIIKIKDSDKQGYKARAVSSNKEKTKWEHIDVDGVRLHEWNEAEVKHIQIKGDFIHIDNSTKKIHIYDTPGPNNSTNQTHSQITQNILSSSKYGFILCVMNASQFGVDDEKRLFETIYKELNKKGSHNKIVFAVNKIDQLDIEAGEKPQDLIKNIKKYLKNFGFKLPHVIPIMSLMSLEIRQIINSYKNNNELNLSSRKQMRFLKDLEYLFEFEDEYMEALMNTKSKNKYLHRAKEQDRGVELNDSICIAGKEIPIKKLIDADILTGIPILEEMLEVELLKASGRYYKKSQKRSLNGYAN